MFQNPPAHEQFGGNFAHLERFGQVIADEVQGRGDDRLIDGEHAGGMSRDDMHRRQMGIANWEWFGLPCYALVLTVFIPIYLKNRTTTVPGFLADRFGPACGTIYSCMLLAFYVCIYTVTVLYAGSLLSQVTGWNFYFVLALIVVGVGPIRSTAD